MEQIIEFFKKQNLYDRNFWTFIKNKIIVISNTSETFWYGCHPIIENNKIKDIRLVVPEIEIEKDILINIHEFTHAIELYQELGKEYEERIEERENMAKEMEKTYLKIYKM